MAVLRTGRESDRSLYSHFAFSSSLEEVLFEQTRLCGPFTAIYLSIEIQCRRSRRFGHGRVQIR